MKIELRWAGSKAFQRESWKTRDVGELWQIFANDQKALDLYNKNDEKYNHLEKSEIEKVVKCLEEKQKWFEEKSYLITKMKPTDDPVVLASQIKDEKDVKI